MSDHPTSALLFGISHPANRIGDDAGNQRIGCVLFTISVMHLRDLHGILNHFSVAFVVVGTLLEYFYFLKHRDRGEQYAWQMLLAGLSFSLISLLTGFFTQEQSYIDTAISGILRYHRLTSILAVVALGAGVAMRISKPITFETVSNGFSRATYIALLTIALFLNAIGIYLGIQMVYDHGVNVRAYEQVIESMPEPSAAPAPTSVPNSKPAGAAPGR